MEKYKYCNIEPTSSPRVGGREGAREEGRQEGQGVGGSVAQEGEATHVKGTYFCIFFSRLRVTGMLRSKKPRAKRAYTCICICI